MYMYKKMAAKHANFDRLHVGILDAGFTHIPLVQKFSHFHKIVVEHQLFKISEVKQKLCFIY